jgi:hypothetical protein
MGERDTKKPVAAGAASESDAEATPTLLSALFERFGSPAGARAIQRRIAQRRERGAAAATNDQAQRVAEHGTSGAAGPLPHLDKIQAAFGDHDVSSIKAHSDASAGQAARALSAEAFATGDHVAFGGAPSLHTAAHEAAHVVQQRKGVHLKSGVGEANDAHEQHADEVADRVVRGESAKPLLDRVAGGGGRGGNAEVQCKLSGAEITAASEAATRLNVPNAAVLGVALQNYLRNYDRIAPQGRLNLLQQVHDALASAQAGNHDAAVPQNYFGLNAVDADGMGATLAALAREIAVEREIVEKQKKEKEAKGDGDKKKDGGDGPSAGSAGGGSGKSAPSASSAALPLDAAE